MQELYTESQIETVNGEEKQKGITGKIVHVIGIFLFYILIFGSISLISHGFDFFSQPESATKVTVERH